MKVTCMSRKKEWYMSCPSIRFLLEIFSPPFILQPIFLVSIWKMESTITIIITIITISSSSSKLVSCGCDQFLPETFSLNSSCVAFQPFWSLPPSFWWISGKLLLIPFILQLFHLHHTNSRVQQVTTLKDIYLVYEARPAQTENFFPHLDLQIKTFQVFQRRQSWILWLKCLSAPPFSLVVYVCTVQLPCYCHSVSLWTSHELFGVVGMFFCAPFS